MCTNSAGLPYMGLSWQGRMESPFESRAPSRGIAHAATVINPAQTPLSLRFLTSLVTEGPSRNNSTYFFGLTTGLVLLTCSEQHWEAVSSPWRSPPRFQVGIMHAKALM